MQIVKQLPNNDKIRLSKELEKDALNTKLSKLLKSFKTNEIAEDIIMQECDLVREKIFKKSHGN